MAQVVRGVNGRGVLKLYLGGESLLAVKAVSVVMAVLAFTV